MRCASNCVATGCSILAGIALLILLFFSYLNNDGALFHPDSTKSPLVLIFLDTLSRITVMPSNNAGVQVLKYVYPREFDNV